MSTSNTARFPTVSGANLEGRRYDLPSGFEGELNIVFVPFQQWHQMLVDGWAAFAKALAGRVPGVRVFEVPTLERFNPIARFWIDNGMRLGIPDRAVRASTITLYVDKPAFRSALSIPDESTMHVLLVRRDGAVLWRAEGEFSDVKGASLAEAVMREVVL